MTQLRYDHEYVEPRSSKAPKIGLVARGATLVSLVVTIAILRINKVTLKNGFKLTYTSFFLSYEFVFYVSSLGMIYTLVQIPFAVYYLLAKKRLINHSSIRYIDFYGDKIVALLLGIGVGAAFGATRDLNVAYRQNGYSKINEFFNLNYIAALFILIGCLACVINSVFSSFALSKGE